MKPNQEHFLSALEHKISNALQWDKIDRWCKNCGRRLTQRGPARRALQTSASTLGWESSICSFLSAAVLWAPVLAPLALFVPHFWAPVLAPGWVRERAGGGDSSGGVQLPTWIPRTLLPVLCSRIHQVHIGSHLVVNLVTHLVTYIVINFCDKLGYLGLSCQSCAPGYTRSGGNNGNSKKWNKTQTYCSQTHAAPGYTRSGGKMVKLRENSDLLSTGNDIWVFPVLRLVDIFPSCVHVKYLTF